jgi:hypothetical protein
MLEILSIHQERYEPENIVHFNFFVSAGKEDDEKQKMLTLSTRLVVAGPAGS